MQTHSTTFRAPDASVRLVMTGDPEIDWESHRKPGIKVSTQEMPDYLIVHPTEKPTSIPPVPFHDAGSSESIPIQTAHCICSDSCVGGSAETMEFVHHMVPYYSFTRIAHYFGNIQRKDGSVKAIGIRFDFSRQDSDACGGMVTHVYPDNPSVDNVLSKCPPTVTKFGSVCMHPDNLLHLYERLVMIDITEDEAARIYHAIARYYNSSVQLVV